jgi:hypothetical protein
MVEPFYPKIREAGGRPPLHQLGVGFDCSPDRG